MSCLGPDYNPEPPKEWYRFQNACPGTAPQIDEAISLNSVDPTTGVLTAYKYQLAVYKKGNVLQYKKNSSDLTKNQRYSQIAKGMWTNRTKTWSSQSESVTNPNSDLLRRINYNTFVAPNYGVDGTETVEPILSTSVIVNCSPGSTRNFAALPTIGTSIISALPAVVKSSVTLTMPPYISRPKILTPQAIQTGGSLIGTIVENPCSGEILQQTYTQDCYSTTNSGVPGPPTLLCWNDGLQTYYPKTRLTYGTSGNKWPTNAKLIFSANSIQPVNPVSVSENYIQF
jgi:hypothetical protein